MDRHAVKSRRRQGIARRTWAVRIETKHRVDRPSAHSAGIVVPWDPTRRIMIELREELTSQTLRTPSLLREVGEEVGVSDVRLIGRIIVILIKDALELVDELALSSHELR